MNRRKISGYGLGNFGFALLTHLGRRQTAGDDFDLHGYDRNRGVIDFLRENTRHPLHHRSVRIAASVTLAESSEELVAGSDILTLAVTSDSVRQVAANLESHIDRELILVNTAKALDAETGLRFSVIVSECLRDMRQPFSLAMFAGGTIAADLAANEPLGVDIASEDARTLEILKDIFATETLHVYTSADIAGVEYAAALKNVVSILAGMAAGLGLSYGSQTYMISRAAGEVKRLVLTGLGGKEETFAAESQCWGNYLWMSCTGVTRNRELGILLGRGYALTQALAEMKEMNKTVEGINTVRAIGRLIEGSAGEFPLLQAVTEIVLGGEDPSTIMARSIAAR